MRKSFILILFLLFFSVINSQTTFFVKYNNSISLDQIEQIVSSKKLVNANVKTNQLLEEVQLNYLANGLLRENQTIGRILTVNTNANISDAELQNLFKGDPSIEYVQTAVNYKLDFMPNDSLITEQWALSKIKAFEAWDITKGSEEILIALIDTGIDYFHPDLKNKIYVNSAEDLNNNGILDSEDLNRIDDDGNGFIDDVIGWDFTDRFGFPFDSTSGDYLTWDNNPIDEQGHGTFVGGIIAAESNNSIGISGVVPNSKLLNIRAFDPKGNGEEDDVASAIIYAVEMGAKVINMSFGDSKFSYVLRDVIKYAYDRGVILVGSSGNTPTSAPHYPSGYTEVISVGNSTEDDFVAGNSTFGSTLDLVAPGTNIIATKNGGGYLTSGGTSASAPHVTGAAALLLSLNPEFNQEDIKQILKSTADDINSPGWDLRSGAGRLNLFRALSLPAASEIKFYFPTQDYAVSSGSIPIKATVLSPYFKDYSLLYGIGNTPSNWTKLIEGNQYQFANEEIFNLDVAGLSDTVYTLRLLVNLTNGKTLEERINFHVDRTAPLTELVNFGEAYFGKQSTIFASVYTDEWSIAKMYYRIKGQSEFNFVSLDGFATNNFFVKQIHYGYIPTSLVQQNTEYEIYFEAENLVGLKTVLNNNGSFFSAETDNNFELASEIKKNYSLPFGRVYQNSVELSPNKKYLMMNEFSDSRNLSIYDFTGNSFTKVDSILERRIPRTAADFNNNSKVDLLSYFFPVQYLDEQVSVSSTQFTNVVSNDTANIPIFAKDIDNDGNFEILSIKDDKLFIHQISNSLQIQEEIVLTNFSEVVPYFGFNNIITSPEAVVDNILPGSNKEIWVVDTEGDILAYKINGANSYSNSALISTGFYGGRASLSSGDYDGDGIRDLAVLLQSFDEVDIAPFKLLLIFNFNDNGVNILYQKAFIDPSQEFNLSGQSPQQKIKFADIDNDSKDELIVFSYPFVYIMKNENNTDKVIAYKENINFESNEVYSNIFADDLDGNGVLEIALPTNNGIEFFEYSTSNKPPKPSGLSGYSINSNSVKLQWYSTGSKNYIYKGLSENDLILIDSTANQNYIDNTITKLNNNYYYAVKTFDNTKPENFSDQSEIIKVYAHEPAKVNSVTAVSGKSLEIKFSEKIKNTIDNIQSFNVLDFGIPQSVSAASEFSYLLNFKNDLPLGTSRISVSGLTDYYNSPIEKDTIDFKVDEVIANQEFFITNYTVIDQYRMKIVFNLDVDPNSLTDRSKFKFTPDNSIEDADVVQSNPKEIIIKTKNPIGSIGIEYLLKIENIFSTTQTGSIKINEGAGSTIVISNFANNLSEMYVYPNPIKLNELIEEKITFANLTQRAEITILTVSGDFVTIIEENDGNGGLDWDLKNERGEKISSGIYIYRVIGKDSNGNEVDTKIGKFAIIR